LARACKLTVRHLLALLPERDPLGSHLATLFRWFSFAKAHFTTG